MRMHSIVVAFVVLFTPMLGLADDLRVGIIGLDTSHVVAFTKILNDASSPHHVKGARVVVAYKGGSTDVVSSYTRIDDFTKTLVDDFGVEIVEDIPTLCSKVDAVLLESVDGRPHLEQLRPVLAARKPVFIDKPLSGSWVDAKTIVRLAKETGVPCFSSSSLRFDPGIRKALEDKALGEVLGCDAFSAASIEEHHPDLYWYGVHGVEILYTIMGPGCESVRRVATPDYDFVVGRWRDGRIGTYRGIRKGRTRYGANVFGAKEIRVVVRESNYRQLVEEIVTFFQTGKPPVELDETLEMFAFMSAADLSKNRGGREVKLSELMGEANR